MPVTKKMGRPRKQEQKMNERVIALFTADERDRLDEIVAKEGRSVSAVVRGAIAKVYPQVFKEK